MKHHASSIKHFNGSHRPIRCHCVNCNGWNNWTRNVHKLKAMGIVRAHQNGCHMRYGNVIFAILWHFNEIRSKYWNYAVSFYTSIWLARRRWTKACICSKSRLLAFRIDQSTGCITVGDNHIERLQQQCKWSETIKSIFPTTTKLFF